MPVVARQFFLLLASKLGAKEVEAFDIDEWSVSNGTENIEVNQCTNIHHQQGKLSELKFSGKFDIILANINKNVLTGRIEIVQGIPDAGWPASAQRFLYGGYP